MNLKKRKERLKDNRPYKFNGLDELFCSKGTWVHFKSGVFATNDPELKQKIEELAWYMYKTGLNVENFRKEQAEREEREMLNQIYPKGIPLVLTC